MQLSQRSKSVLLYLKDKGTQVHPEVTIVCQCLQMQVYVVLGNAVAFHISYILYSKHLPVLVVVSLQHNVQLRMRAIVVDSIQRTRLVFR